MIVAVTIPPLAEFVEKVGGDRVNVFVMVPPGASPHTYEPTPAQLVNVSQAKMYVKVGTAIEFELAWLNKLVSTNNRMLVTDASAGIDVKATGHDTADQQGGYSHRGHHRPNDCTDPHIWLSPRNARTMVENIYDGLISVDAANRDYYKTNKERYLQELDSLHRSISEILNGKIDRRFMVHHPAWGWFAQDYDLEQIPVEIDAKEPTAQGMKSLVDQAGQHGIRTIFASPQFSVRSTEAIAREIHGHVVLIDPLAKDYVDNLRQVTQALADAME